MLGRRAWSAVFGVVGVVAGLLVAVGDAAPAGAQGCGNYQCTLLGAVAPVSTGDATSDFGAWLLGDFNHDGVLDLYGLKTRNTASGHVELHILSGASGYRDWLLHAVLPISVTDAANFSAWQLGRYQNDSIPDLYGVKTGSTASGRVEVHVLSGASNYQMYALHSATAFSANQAIQDFGAWQIGSNEPAPDLYGIKTAQTGSGRVEVHALSGASNFSLFSLHAATAFASGDASNYAAWQVSQFSGDGQPDLYAIQTHTGSGYVEVHVVSRVSYYTSFLLHAVTMFPASTASNFGSWALGDFNGAGILDLFGTQTANTASGDVELDVVNGVSPPTSNCTTLNACAPKTFSDAIFAYPGIDAPASTSNEAAFEVWQTAEGGGAGCPGQAPYTSPWQDSAGPAGNPLNTTQREPGSTNWNNLGGGIGVQIFHNYDNQTCWYWGVKATGDTLLNGYYPNILAVLLTPSSNSYTQCVNLANAVGNSPWGTGNFKADCSGLSATRSPRAPVGPALASLPGSHYSAGGPGTPRYVITVQRGPSGAVSGSVMFVYQDGRTREVTTYSGHLGAGGHVVLATANGRTLTGTLSPARLELPGCEAVLQGAGPARCSFAAGN